MSNVTVTKGQNLWNIVKTEYGLTNNTDIANKVNEIAKANNLKNGGNSIFAGQQLSLPESQKTESVFGAQQSNATNPITDKTPEVTESANTATSDTADTATTKGIAPVNTEIPEATVEEKTNPFDTWTKKAAMSAVYVDENNQPIYGNDVPDYDMAGDEFRNDIKTNGGENAGKIYQAKALETAQGEISLFDTDGDGTINREEQVRRDLKEALKLHPETTDEELHNISIASLRTNMFMDLDKDKKVDDKEYAAYIRAMDSNNDKQQANGKITRAEYVKAVSYTEKPLDDEAGTFRGLVRGCYKSFYGTDPAAQYD